MYLPLLSLSLPPMANSLSKTSTSFFLPLGPAEINERSWSSGVFRIYNLNILPHTHCCCVSDEQQPLSCSLLHPRLTMCQIPGIIQWQCTHRIMLKTTGTSPASSHTQAAELGRSCLCWTTNPITLKIKTNLKVTSRSFYFATNKTHHRVNYKAAGNCTLTANPSSGTMCITAYVFTASCLKFPANGNCSSALCVAPGSNSFLPGISRQPAGSAWIRGE